MYDDLPHDATVSFNRVHDEHDDPNTDVTVGRKDPGDGVQFRLEVYWNAERGSATSSSSDTTNENDDQREVSSWYDPSAFEAFLNGIVFNDDLLQKL